MKSATVQDGAQMVFHRVHISSKVDIRRKLQRGGFCHWQGGDLVYAPEAETFWQDLQAASSTLPRDEYCKAGNRYRRYAQYVTMPWSNTLQPLPPGEYYQSAEYNAVDGGVGRWFAPLTPREQLNPFLLGLIWFDLHQIPWPKKKFQRPIQVGVHFVKHVAEPGRAGISSPDELHRDGEPYTFVHLVERSGVEGGVNTIAPLAYTGYQPTDVPPNDLLLQVVLTSPLDSFVVSDVAVCHHVSAVNVMPGYERGSRSVLLIEFLPLIPEIV